MVCLNEIECDILKQNITYKECLDFIYENSSEVYLVSGGFKIKNIKLSGVLDFPIGFCFCKSDENDAKDIKNKIIFQYIKPCFGIFILKIDMLKSESDELKKRIIKENGKRIK